MDELMKDYLARWGAVYFCHSCHATVPFDIRGEKLTKQRCCGRPMPLYTDMPVLDHELMMTRMIVRNQKDQVIHSDLKLAINRKKSNELYQDFLEKSPRHFKPNRCIEVLMYRPFIHKDGQVLAYMPEEMLQNCKITAQTFRPPQDEGMV